MQYLLMDAHRRFLGTFTSSKVLSVGDTFQNHEKQSFAVVGINWAGHGSSMSQAITVIPLHKLVKKPQTPTLSEAVALS